MAEWRAEDFPANGEFSAVTVIKIKRAIQDAGTDADASPEYGRIEHDGWVTRWGKGWQFTYPVGATITVTLVDDNGDPIDG